jgi:hypothetical protein
VIIRRPAKGKGIARKIKRSKWKKGRVFGKELAAHHRRKLRRFTPLRSPNR